MKEKDKRVLLKFSMGASAFVIVLGVYAGLIYGGVKVTKTALDEDIPSGLKDGFYHALYKCPDGNSSGAARWVGNSGAGTDDRLWALYNERDRFLIQLDERCTVTLLEGDVSKGRQEDDP